MKKKVKLFRKRSSFKLCSLVILYLCTIMNLSAQSTSPIKGVVKNEEGETLIGVKVKVKESNLETQTDIDGQFTLTIPVNSNLEFSYLGYKPQTKLIENTSFLTVIMQESAKELDEVVVVAYGSQRKKDLIGSVSIVDTKAMKKMASPGIGQALQGLAAGVSVTTSGAPGSTPDIRIRGVGSFGDVGPLYVIDGMIMDGAQREVNPNDIESMQILKDAAASALYGSRGANGVILITTKKGVEGPTRIDVSANFGIQNIAKKYDVMNSIEFLKVNKLAYQNAGLVWPGEPAQGARVHNTDWQDEFYKTGFTQDLNTTVSGASKNSNYMFSLNYYDQDGVVKGPDYQRYSLRSNTQAKLGMFTIGENATFARSKTHPVIGNPFIDLARMPPVIPVRTESGGYGVGSTAYPTYGTNPIGLQETTNVKQVSNRFMGNAYLQVDPMAGLVIKSSVGIEYHNWVDKEVSDYKEIRYLTTYPFKNQLLERNGNFTTWIWENTAAYNKEIGKHKFDLLGGYSVQKKDWKNTVGIGRNLTPGYWVLNQSSKDAAVSGDRYIQTMISWLGRVNYSYNDKYLAQFNIRHDGSSRFGANHRWGTFPSASVGWRISEESFMDSTRSIIDDLKIRASYGVLGDQQALGDYQYSTYIITGDGAVFGSGQTYYPGKIQKGRANPDLKWETKRTMNLGIDFNLLNQHLYGTIEYYNSTSKDLLLQAQMAWVDGTDISPWTNLGKVNNRGFDITLGYRETQKEFKYNIALNMSTLRNRVEEMDEEYRTGGTSGINKTTVGRSISEFWVLKTDGIFQNWDEVYAHTASVKNPTTGAMETIMIQPNAQPGDIRYKDVNGDGAIGDADRCIVGKAIPSVEFGLNLSGEYKNFDLNLFLTGVTGNKIFNNSKYYLEKMDETSNYSKNLKPWTPENPSNTTPRPLISTGDSTIPNDNIIITSDRWIEDGKYIRLKNIQLGYTFSQNILRKIDFIRSARIYVGAQNLFTITGYSGLDPEISGGNIFGKGNDDGHFPPVRTFSAGVQISF